jgi:hypothetical protein
MGGVRNYRATAVIAAALLASGCAQKAQGEKDGADTGAVREGAMVVVSLKDSLSTERNLQGDLFHAVLADSLPGNGGPGIPAGTSVSGVIADLAQPAPDAKARMGLKLVHFETPEGRRIEVSSEPLTVVAETSSGGPLDTASGADSVVAANEGGVLGRVLGSGNGTEMGAALGPSVGTVVVIAMRDRHVRLEAGQRLQFALAGPLAEQRLSL